MAHTLIISGTLTYVLKYVTKSTSANHLWSLLLSPTPGDFIPGSANGVIDDVPLDPTASNNYQTANVMNGSYINNFNAKITLKNIDSSDPITLDLYQVAVSFYDVLIWETLFDSAYLPGRL